MIHVCLVNNVLQLSTDLKKLVAFQFADQSIHAKLVLLQKF